MTFPLTSTFPLRVFVKRSSSFVWLVERRRVDDSLRVVTSGDDSANAEVFYRDLNQVNKNTIKITDKKYCIQISIPYHQL